MVSMSHQASSSSGSTPFRASYEHQITTHTMAKCVQQSIDKERSGLTWTQLAGIEGVSYILGLLGSIPFVKSSILTYQSLPIAPQKELSIATTVFSQAISAGYYLSDELQTLLKDRLTFDESTRKEYANLIGSDKNPCARAGKSLATLTTAALNSVTSFIMDHLDGGSLTESSISFASNIGNNHSGARYLVEELIPSLNPGKLCKKKLSSDKDIEQSLKQFKTQHIAQLQLLMDKMRGQSDLPHHLEELMDDCTYTLSKTHSSDHELQVLINKIHLLLARQPQLPEQPDYDLIRTLITVVTCLSSIVVYSSYIFLTAKGLSKMTEMDDTSKWTASTIVSIPQLSLVTKAISEITHNIYDSISDWRKAKRAGQEASLLPHWLSDYKWLLAPMALTYLSTYWSAPYFLQLNQSIDPHITDNKAWLALSLSVYVAFNNYAYTPLVKAAVQKNNFRREAAEGKAGRPSIEALFSELEGLIQKMTPDHYNSFLNEWLDELDLESLSERGTFGQSLTGVLASVATQKLEPLEEKSVSEHSLRIPLGRYSMPV